ncbi:unnamed protein product [Meganyctiphanes norvegica]|uniref:Cuticle protein n=1 Tax=Meganyctiphanes norvegica TaxID=48144 RepID=A0AAV2SAS9_MEGNR
MLVKALSVLVVLGLTLGAPTYDNQKPKGMPYDFGYGVQDEYRGVAYDHSEDSDGNVVRGSYSVLLPDGRMQIVTYEADHENGYRANVEYIGEAQFPSKSGTPVTFKPQTQNSYQQEQHQPQSLYQAPQQQQQLQYGQ